MAAIPLTPRGRRGRLPRPLALVAAAGLVAAGTFAFSGPFSRPEATGPSAPTDVEPARATEPAPALGLPDGGGSQPALAQVDAAIATWTGNLERDGADFIAATHLAELYLARGRLTALPDDHARALAAVDRALEIEPGLLAARLLRCQVLLATHDFAGAADAAAVILEDHPALPAALAALGDAHLELGAYAAAREAYARLAASVDSPAVIARLARHEAVTGSLPGARELAARAIDAALSDPSVSLSDRAWYHVLAGTLAFQDGDLADADAAFRAALDLDPASSAAAAGLGRALAAGGDLDAAIVMLERAVEAVPQPEVLATLADVLDLAGRAEEAETRRDQVRAFIAIAAEGATSAQAARALALFLANHGERTGLAVSLAEAELEQRRDVYAWDTLAWALLADGRVADADEAMGRARAHGTQDALLDYHAGAIAAAAGRHEEAIDLLRGALDRNLGFDPLQAARAGDLLAELEAGR